MGHAFKKPAPTLAAYPGSRREDAFSDQLGFAARVLPLHRIFRVRRGPALLAQAQLVPNGTASTKLALPIGTHSVKAVFAGTKTDAASSSSAETLTVTGLHATSTAISASGTSPYTLAATVSGNGSQPIVGNVSVFDTSNENDSLGTAALVAGTTKSAFVPQSLPGTGSEPVPLAVADFNRDGYPDLAFGNINPGNGAYTGYTLTMFLSSGPGTYSTPITVGLPNSFQNPSAMTTGDFNLMGAGDGTFKPTASSPDTGIYTDWITISDFNNDGNQDLPVANQFSKTVTILLGDGKGNFTGILESPATGQNPDSVAVGDFNSDSIEDLAVANPNDNTVTILLGKGDGTFPTAQTVPLTSGTAPYSVTVADLNSDGVLDFAVAGSGNNPAAIVLNTETATATLTGVQIPGGGKHRIDAGFPGNGTYRASMSGFIDLAGTPIPTTVFLTAPIAGAGQTVSISTIVLPTSADNFTISGTVSFYNGSTLLATAALTNGRAVLSASFPTAGTYSLTAQYSGSTNFAASSSTTPVDRRYRSREHDVIECVDEFGFIRYASNTHDERKLRRKGCTTRISDLLRQFGGARHS
jgi:hypothetical protein